jgi:hypothetical protein
MLKLALGVVVAVVINVAAVILWACLLPVRYLEWKYEAK